MYFKELTLHPHLQRGIAERGYTVMTQVQERTLARTLLGADAAVQSQTGTGKTAAFLITIFERLLEDGAAPRKKALIIVPTRELAVQIEGEAALLNRPLGFAVGNFYGGVGYDRQLASLRAGLDIIIGTPGRLLDLSRRGLLSLQEVSLLVIDEADRLFDMGFLPDLEKLLRKMPPPSARQSMLFSATLSRISKRIAAVHMNRPENIALTPKRLTVDTISQELYHVKSHLKVNLLLGILQTETPRNALIFANMRYAAARLAKALAANGYRCRHLTGDLPQTQRLRVIEDFNSGRFPILVATDVAARGLHIDGLEMVINYDLPQDFENYVHRIGRTARAGKSGKAVSFACEKYAKHLDDIESFIGQKIPVRTAVIELYATDLSLEAELREKSRRLRSTKTQAPGKKDKQVWRPAGKWGQSASPAGTGR